MSNKLNKKKRKIKLDTKINMAADAINTPWTYHNLNSHSDKMTKSNRRLKQLIDEIKEMLKKG